MDKLNLRNYPHQSFTASCYDDSDFDSDSDISTKKPPSCFSQLKDSSRIRSLHRSSMSSKKKKGRRINCVEIDLNDPCAPIEILDNIETHQLFCVQMYTAGINTIQKEITKFINGMDCAIYRKKHTFEKCPILNDILYIKKHYISYCILMNWT